MGEEKTYLVTVYMATTLENSKMQIITKEYPNLDLDVLKVTNCEGMDYFFNLTKVAFWTVIEDTPKEKDEEKTLHTGDKKEE